MRPGAVANLIIGGGGGVFALVAAYAVWNHERYFATGLRIVVFGLLPLVASIALFAALRLSPLHKLRLALLLVTTALCVYGLEAFATVRSSQGEVRRAAQDGRQADTRTKLAVVRELRAQGTDAYPSVYPSEMVKAWLRPSSPYRVVSEGEGMLPLAGISGKQTVLCNESGVYQIYEADEHGFHNPPGIWSSPRHPIAVVGDSFAQGYCVASGSGTVDRIRDAFPGTLNLGMQGNGPLLELATMREFLPALEPAVVLWFYFEGNDLGSELPLESRHPLLRRYLEDDDFRQDLVDKQPAVDRGLAEFVNRRMDETPASRESLFLQHVVKFAKLASLRDALGWGVSNRQLDFEMLREILGEAKRSLEPWGGELIFVYLPERDRYKPSLLSRDDSVRLQVLEISKELGLPLVDMHASFMHDPKPLRFFAGFHYNQDGYDRLAREIVEYIGGPR